MFLAIFVFFGPRVKNNSKWKKSSTYFPRHPGRFSNEKYTLNSFLIFFLYIPPCKVYLKKHRTFYCTIYFKTIFRFKFRRFFLQNFMRVFFFYFSKEGNIWNLKKKIHHYFGAHFCNFQITKKKIKSLTLRFVCVFFHNFFKIQGHNVCLHKCHVLFLCILLLMFITLLQIDLL